VCHAPVVDVAPSTNPDLLNPLVDNVEAAPLSSFAHKALRPLHYVWELVWRVLVFIGLLVIGSLVRSVPVVLLLGLAGVFAKFGWRNALVTAIVWVVCHGLIRLYPVLTPPAV
jgi:hypothetical protein